MSRLLKLPAPAALAAAVLFFVWTAYASLGFWHWGDEDEKIVAAWMIAEGFRLYDTAFAHHGALNYAAAHLVSALGGSTALAPYRVFQWLTLFAAGLAVAASPLLDGLPRRLCALALYLALVAFLYPLWYGHTLLYHSLAGVSFLVALSLFVLPLMAGLAPSVWRSAVGGAALSAACFAAYPFAVPVVLLAAAATAVPVARGDAGSRLRAPLSAAALGFAAFTALMVLWLARYGDLLGYLVYHVWFNQAVYAGFIDYDPSAVLRQLRLLFQSPLGWLLNGLLLFGVLFGAEVAASAPRESPRWRRLLLGAGLLALFLALLFLNPRGERVYKNGAMWVVGLGLLSLAVCWKARAARNRRTAAAVRWLGAALAAGAVAYIVGVKEMSYVDVRLVTREHAEDKLRSYERRIRLMDDLVPPDTPILATVFSPRWYLLARRLPSSGNYYYLPWQAAYNRDPVLGRQIDICADVDRDRPKIIVWDRWRVWERYSLEDYEPCLVERMRRDYLKIQRTPFLVRRPVAPGDRETIRRHGFSLAPLSPGG